MRKILVDRGRKRNNLGARAAMAFLNASDPRAVRVLRNGLARWGFRGLNLAHLGVRAMGLLGRSEDVPAATAEPPGLGRQVVEMARRPVRVEVPGQSFRNLLDIEDSTQVPILFDPAKDDEGAESVFYFPGCGSERLFSDIGLATLAMLYETGARTVLPPGYLCCGYPQTSAGLAERGRKITTENRVLFHRVANTLNYLDIKTVLVSCGTCMDQLLKYEFKQIFPGCRLLDIHEYLLEKGLSLTEPAKTKFLYHDPCHSPMKTHHPLQVVSRLTGQPVRLSDRCCGEAGTLGTTRPDIANQVRFRKQEELSGDLMAVIGKPKAQGGEAKLLTSCPACQQGLSKFADATGLKTEYIVVEMARDRLGPGWQTAFIERVRAGGVERVLL
jgi:Fe-S oxidoreductase